MTHKAKLKVATILAVLIVSSCKPTFINSGLSSTASTSPSPSPSSSASASTPIGTASVTQSNSSAPLAMVVHAVQSTGAETASRVAADPVSGAFYYSGKFAGNASFGLGSNAVTRTSNGLLDGFVSKFNADGTHAWTIVLGSTQDDAVTALTLDPSGNVIAGGYFGAVIDFDPSPATFNLTPAGVSTGSQWVAKYTSAGAFVWAHTWGNATASSYPVNDLVTEADGDVWATGTFGGVVDFDPGAGTNNITASGADIYITRINSNGTYSGWTKKIGGANSDEFPFLGMNANGELHVVAAFKSSNTNFNIDGGSDLRSPTGQTDAFVLKLNADYSYNSTKTWGTGGYDYPTGIVFDSAGNGYVAGDSFGPSSGDFDFTAGTDIWNVLGGVDGFVVRINADGTYGGKTMFTSATAGDKAYAQNIIKLSATRLGVVVQQNGTIDYDASAGVSTLTSAGGDDIAFVEINMDGSLVGARRWGSTLNDKCARGALSKAGEILMSCWFDGTVTFSSMSGDTLTSFGGGSDAVLLRTSPTL